MRPLAQHGLLSGAIALVGILLSSPAQAEEKAPTEKAKSEKARTWKVKAVKNLDYYDGPGKDKNKHKLDLYLPEGGKDFPVLFFVHGGAWVFGDRGDFFGLLYGGLGNFYAKQGIGVVVISYRLSPGVTHPEHVKDVARAFAWTYKNIGRYGGKTDRLFLCGHSAGGHLVSLLSTDERYLKAHDLSPKNIRAVIPISGVYRVPANFLPRVFGTDDDAGKKASPITYVKKGLPPFFILYADRDLPGCDKKPSEAFCKALCDKGTKAKTLEIKESNHYNILFDAGKRDTTVSTAILGFIREQAGK
jgi:acetyl esterase/lipase